MKQVVILGSTGSVGRQAMSVVEATDGLRLVGLSANRSWREVVEVALRHGVGTIALADPVAADHARRHFPGNVLEGPAGATDLARTVEADIVLNALVGAAGLEPSIAALASGQDLALANKESLVVGGELVMRQAAESGVQVLPVDSEPAALRQLLGAVARADVSRLTITASGGPFRGQAAQDFEDSSPSEALAHPVWSMGPKNSIDSATLMNKGLEVIESHHLFDMPYDQIDVLVQPGSLVHGLLSLKDGSMHAHVGYPDMRTPIAHALHAPNLLDLEIEPPDLTAVGSLAFEAVDSDAFPCLAIARQAGTAGGTNPCVMNAANEVAVKAFLSGRLRFGDIPALIVSTLEGMPTEPVTTLESLLEVDAAARLVAGEILAQRELRSSEPARDRRADTPSA